MLEDRDELKRRIKALLEQHVGPANAILMGQVYVNVTGDVLIPWKRHDQTRPIRTIVQQLRREGCPIVSGRNGYYWSTDPADREPTIRRLHSQAMTILRTEADLKNISKKELLRQYELEFNQEASQ